MHAFPYPQVQAQTQAQTQAPPQGGRGGPIPAYAMGAYSQMQQPRIPMGSGSVGGPPGSYVSSGSSGSSSRASAVLYYSNYCTHCNNLLRMIASRNLRSFFALVCVDQDQERRKVPDFVKSVPMAFVSGRATGGAPLLLEQGSLLEYIERCASQRQQQQQQQNNPQQQQVQQVQQEVELEAAACAGGDSYSWLNDDEGKAGDGAPGRTSTGSLFYEFTGKDDGFGPMLDGMAPPPSDPRGGGDPQNHPSFASFGASGGGGGGGGGVETRRQPQNQNEVEVSSIEALRRAEEEKWFPKKRTQ